MRSFKNDYSEGAAPQILDAIVATNAEQTVGYTEGDPYTERARTLVRDACGQPDAMVEFCIGGTSANLVCVSGLLRDYEGVICTPDAHIVTHETGAIGACSRTTLPTRDTDGFLSVEEAERVWQFQMSCGRHMTKPALVYITNSTEFGGVWDRARFDAICDWAQARHCKVYVDGARLGPALESPANDLSLRHIASRADAFSIGGTKNGMLFGEAVVIRDPGLKRDFPYLQKTRGGLMAKGRLLGVQFAAAFEDGLYWRLARHANECALALRDGLVAAGFEPFLSSSTNQQFFCVDAGLADTLEEACGCEIFLALPDGRKVVRFVCSWATSQADVAELVAFCASL
ncbi:beta-eliminating lyase-related protein [Atopobiaceae bacterium 24-176]